MADVLKLKRGATELNLLAAEGAGLRVQKWFPKMADVLQAGVPPYLVEDMDILVDRTSHDNLATSIQALDAMRRWAALFRGIEIIRDPVWLHAKMDGETGERRAHVRAIHGEWRSDQVGPSGHPAAYDALNRLQIERHPYWEALTYTTGTSMDATAAASIKHNYGTVVGDVGARVTALRVTRGAVGDVMDRVWLGFRSSLLSPTPGNFENIWECEDTDTTAGTDCGAPTTDSTASPGSGNTKRVVSFATETGWDKRLTFEAQDIGYYDDTLGRMLWLFRTKVDAATECEVQLRFGFALLDDDEYIQGPILTVDSTSWDYKEMGEAQIPPINMQVNSTLATTANISALATIQIWARRTSGTGSLHLDCLCPIPLDEGWLVAKEIGADSTGDYLLVMQTPYDHYMVSSQDTVNLQRRPIWSVNNLYFPPGDGRVIVVYARETSSVLTDQIALYPYYTPRWANLRGSE